VEFGGVVVKRVDALDIGCSVGFRWREAVDVERDAVIGGVGCGRYARQIEGIRGGEGEEQQGEGEHGGGCGRERIGGRLT